MSAKKKIDSIEISPAVRESLNTETSQIAWKDLQRFFAGGYTLRVDKALDLIDVACHFHQDNATQVAQWLDGKQVEAVSNEEAKRWFEADQILWAVVIKPWVLVQEEKPATPGAQ